MATRTTSIKETISIVVSAAEIEALLIEKYVTPGARAAADVTYQFRGSFALDGAQIVFCIARPAIEETDITE